MRNNNWWEIHCFQHDKGLSVSNKKNIPTGDIYKINTDIVYYSESNYPWSAFMNVHGRT
jgi:thymidylate synthase ThyX